MFSGEGGSSTASAIDTTAAGDLWDAFDGMTNAAGQQTDRCCICNSWCWNNAFFYTSPELVDGLTVTASFGQSSNNTNLKLVWCKLYWYGRFNC